MLAKACPGCGQILSDDHKCPAAIAMTTDRPNVAPIGDAEIKAALRSRKATNDITSLVCRWRLMHHRCTSPKSSSWKDYGARGIEVCAEWKEFEPFYRWAVASGFKRELQLDRINVNGHYEPTNCRWVTVTEQQNNRRDSRSLTYNGVTKPLKVWAEEYGIDHTTLRGRLSRFKWSVEKALTTPAEKILPRYGNQRIAYDAGKFDGRNEWEGKLLAAQAEIERLRENAEVDARIAELREATIQTAARRGWERGIEQAAKAVEERSSQYTEGGNTDWLVRAIRQLEYNATP